MPQSATAFFTGGNDGIIHKWSATFTKTATINLSIICPVMPGIRSVCVAKEGHLLVGTIGSQVVEVDQTGKLKSSIVNGHFQGVPAFAEIWGCTAHPTEQVFATSGSDRRIRVWGPKKMIAVSEPFEYDVTALDWSSDGTFIAVGDRKGVGHVVDSKSLKVLGTMAGFLSKGKQPWVEDIKVSPNCKYVAFGTHDGLSHLEIAEVNLKAAPG